jgi:hypothetical protein
MKTARITSGETAQQREIQRVSSKIVGQLLAVVLQNVPGRIDGTKGHALIPGGVG